MLRDNSCPRKEYCTKLYCSSPVNLFVEDQEELIRILFHPDHVDKDGNVSIAAISEEDILSKGVSVDRKNRLTAEKYKKIIKKLCLKPETAIDFVATAPASEIRQAGNNSACICPSGKSGRRSHSDIYAISKDIDEKAIHFLRDDLREAFSQAIKLENFYEQL